MELTSELKPPMTSFLKERLQKQKLYSKAYRLKSEWYDKISGSQTTDIDILTACPKVGR